MLTRARTLAAMSRAPAAHVERHRVKLHQHLREMRASASRVVSGGERSALTRATVLARRADATEGVVDRAGRRSLTAAETLGRVSVERRRASLEALALALAAHDPQRTLERGYALVEGPSGEPVTSADAARTLDAMTLRLHDGTLPVRPA